MKRGIFVSKLTGIKDIGERNKAFHRLGKEQKRKELAWDSLNLLIRKKLKSPGKRSHYWPMRLENIDIPDSKKFQEKIVDIVENGQHSCTVCARGAIMVSTVRLGNKISGNTFLRYSGQPRILQGFTLTDMKRMEDNYENYTVIWLSGKDVRFPYKRQTTKRLANIFCNVLANGNFKLTDLTDYLKLWNIKV
jgi:hypothetical protein